MTTLPPPLVPAEVDLRDYARMPLDFERLFSSDTWVLGNPEEKVAALHLWCRSWHQVPAGSLPNDERILAHLSAAGARWRKLRPHAMRGWVECSDGRLYHPVVAELALEAWDRKRYRKEVGTAKSTAGTRGAEARWGAPASEHQATRSQRLAEARQKGSHTAVEWLALCEVVGDRCVKCGIHKSELNSEILTKDHIQPIYQGGDDSIKNIQPMCRNCNSAKGQQSSDLRPPDWETRVAKRVADFKETHGETPAIREVKSREVKVFTPPEWINAEAWAGFEEMRKAIKKPMTDRARQLIVADLAEMLKQGHDPNRSLDISTRNNWQGVYAPKVDRAAPGGARGDLAAGNSATARDWAQNGGKDDKHGPH